MTEDTWWCRLVFTAHPKLSIDGDHGEEQHHGERAPEVRVVSDHLPEVRRRLVALSTQLHALQAAVIRQDSILELSIRTDSAPLSSAGLAPGPRLTRSMSRDAGLDASGEALLLRRQVELLQEEVTRLRRRGEEPSKEGAEPGKKKRSNGEISHVNKGEQVGQGF
ncbi:Rho guanine nucleotide exchange factor 2 [Liparis tanakae]|uniref:Rho guanine nucleotide exchange factor 2 n=1 Tax=Liparis tanakae TaxID=230148 RepID=A0A4Z2FKF6_9TELE|nr:Rho guanine nucleotide exchange factor 2 [Liparis tanakae]